jgi:hypothetical protein
MTGLCCGNKY